MLSDSSDIDTAVIQKLSADTTLLQLMPNNVHWDEAPKGSTQFVIVSLVNADDVPGFGGRAIEDVLYLVKAVELTTVPTPHIKAAAKRIDALLDGATLTITGYGCMVVRRDSRVRYLEVDERDSTIRWQHRGGRYQVMAAPAS